MMLLMMMMMMITLCPPDKMIFLNDRHNVKDRLLVS